MSVNLGHFLYREERELKFSTTRKRRQEMAATGKRFKTERIVNLLREIKVLVDQWVGHYNTTRPHSSLGYKSPAPEAIINMPMPMQTLHSVMH